MAKKFEMERDRDLDKDRDRFGEFRRFLSELEGESRLRRIPDEDDGKLIDLTTNDYMGLASDREPLPLCWEGLPEDLRKEYEEYMETDPLSRADQWSSSASRLLSGRQRIFNLLERILESDYGKPTLLFNSGYHANVGAIGALTRPGVSFFVDKLMHASAYDGLAAGRSEFRRFRHNDLDQLVKMLDATAPEELKVIVTESVFSMDGDRAPLRELASLRREREDLLLYVDEAHGFGCYGDRGLGVAEEEGVVEEIDILIGTFGKAGASAGAFVAAAEPLHSLFVNASRSFIFSTALPPVVVLHSLENYLRLRGAKERRERLRVISRELAGLFGAGEAQSHIIPLHAGSAERAIAMAAELRERGFKGLPIRRPTVPPGGERVRISACATLELRTRSKERALK